MALDKLADEILQREGVKALTDEECKALHEFATEAGEQRARRGLLESEADFLAGVLCAFFAFGRADKVPAAWVFGPLTGRKVFGPDAEWGKEKKCTSTD